MNQWITLGGEQSVVAKDVDRVAEIGQAMGFTLNVSKCELITESGTVVCDQSSSLSRGFRCQKHFCSVLHWLRVQHWTRLGLSDAMTWPERWRDWSSLWPVRLERPASCIRESRCWYSATMLSFCTTVCRPLTAQIDWLIDWFNQSNNQSINQSINAAGH